MLEVHDLKDFVRMLCKHGHAPMGHFLFFFWGGGGGWWHHLCLNLVPIMPPFVEEWWGGEGGKVPTAFIGHYGHESPSKIHQV